MNRHWIRYREAGTGNIIHTHAEFTEIEIKTIGQFAEYAHSLGSSSFFKDGQSLKFNITWSESDGISSDCEMPNDDYVSAFLHRLRPFILQDELTHFHKICKILSRRLEESAIRKAPFERHSGQDLII